LQRAAARVHPLPLLLHVLLLHVLLLLLLLLPLLLLLLTQLEQQTLLLLLLLLLLRHGRRLVRCGLLQLAKNRLLLRGDVLLLGGC